MSLTVTINSLKGETDSLPLDVDPTQHGGAGGTSFKAKVKGKKTTVSYLQLTGCPAAGLPVRAVAHFIDENGNPAGDVTNDSVAKC